MKSLQYLCAEVMVDAIQTGIYTMVKIKWVSAREYTIITNSITQQQVYIPSDLYCLIYNLIERLERISSLIRKINLIVSPKVNQEYFNNNWHCYSQQLKKDIHVKINGDDVADILYAISGKYLGFSTQVAHILYELRMMGYYVPGKSLSVLENKCLVKYLNDRCRIIREMCLI